MSDNCGHVHKTENGIFIRCYHSCRSVLLSGAFWIGITISYPFEHFLWENVWPFSWVTQQMHSTDNHKEHE